MQQHLNIAKSRNNQIIKTSWSRPADGRPLPASSCGGLARCARKPTRFARKKHPLQVSPLWNYITCTGDKPIAENFKAQTH